MKTRLFSMVLSLCLLVPGIEARADTDNFELTGSIYTKWLYRNNDSQGVLSYGNPFWPDDIAGDNGVGSEFELGIVARASKHVEAGVRLKSRFGGLWQDWWESGNIQYDEPNTSGDSLGMNRSQYLKLRGVYVRVAPPIPTLDWVHVGASDLSMFNEWTIGKIRYIDRDNANGSFIQGHVGDDNEFEYQLGIIALPKLWVGPWWSTGVGDPNVVVPFMSNDYAYGSRFDITPSDWGTFTLVSTLTYDLEIDSADPDAVGSLYPNCEDELGNPVPGCEHDHAVGTFTRYINSVSTLEAALEPTDLLSINLLGGYSAQRLDPNLTANGVEMNDGVFPIVYADTDSYAARARFELADPFDVGLSFRSEYFNIGQHWSSIFGARREADVLWTDGFISGGQLPTLNLANEFVDFDEPWFESCIGWHGATLLTDYDLGSFSTTLEYTFITYNTNGQDRDTDQTYPDFLHSDGFTDTDLYDYANTLDRGRDPRSVYRENQERRTQIAVLTTEYVMDVGHGLILDGKGKYIGDEDSRSQALAEDDYSGTLLHGAFGIAYPFTDELKIRLGGSIDRWFEDNRTGSLLRNGTGEIASADYADAQTAKEKATLTLRYTFEALQFGYYLEYLHKEQERETLPDQTYHVIRSKATMGVSF